MACILTAGRAQVCKDSLGGNSVLYLFDFIEDPFTVSAGNEATAINVGITSVFLYALEGDGNNLVQDFVSDRNTGTSVNTETSTVVLKKIDATTSAEMNILTRSFAQAVVKDRNGVYHALGIDDGIDWSVSEATGGAKTDLNGYTLTGVSTTGALAAKLDASTVTALLALV